MWSAAAGASRLRASRPGSGGRGRPLGGRSADRSWRMPDRQPCGLGQRLCTAGRRACDWQMAVSTAEPVRVGTAPAAWPLLDCAGLRLGETPLLCCRARSAQAEELCLQSPLCAAGMRTALLRERQGRTAALSLAACRDVFVQAAAGSQGPSRWSSSSSSNSSRGQQMDGFVALAQSEVAAAQPWLTRRQGAASELAAPAQA